MCNVYEWTVGPPHAFRLVKTINTKKCRHVTPNTFLLYPSLFSASRPHHSCHHHWAARFPSWILPFENRLLCRQGLPGLLLRRHPRFWRLSQMTVADWRRIPSFCQTVYSETVACCLPWVSECTVCSRYGKTLSLFWRLVFVYRCSVQEFNRFADWFYNPALYYHAHESLMNLRGFIYSAVLSVNQTL